MQSVYILIFTHNFLNPPKHLTNAMRQALHLTRCTLFLVTILLCKSSSKAQNFMMSAGSTLSILQDEGILKHITFSLRGNLYESESSSASLRVLPSIGFGSGQDEGTYFVTDFPITADFNLGFKSSPDNESNFGGFIGGGFAYTIFSRNDPYVGKYRFNTYGPLVHGGVRFRVADDLGIEIGLFYKKGIEAGRLQAGGLRVLFAW
jgi:hypothetical protein